MCPRIYFLGMLMLFKKLFHENTYFLVNLTFIIANRLCQLDRYRHALSVANVKTKILANTSSANCLVLSITAV